MPPTNPVQLRRDIALDGAPAPLPQPPQPPQPPGNLDGWRNWLQQNRPHLVPGHDAAFPQPAPPPRWDVRGQVRLPPQDPAGFAQGLGQQAAGAPGPVERFGQRHAQRLTGSSPYPGGKIGPRKLLP